MHEVRSCAIPDSNSQLVLLGVQMANVSVADKVAAAEKEVAQQEHEIASASDALERAAIRNRLAAKDQLLASYRAGDAWKQQGSKALLKVDGQVLMYANIIVINDRVQPPIECRMRALVDTAAGLELMIPPCKAQQLQLLERSRGHLKGGEEGWVEMIQYAPVLVKLTSEDSSGRVQTFRQADLTVFAKGVPLDEQEDVSDSAGCRQSQQLTPDGNLQLMPVNSPPRGDIATAIIGREGLRQLRVTVKPEQALLCPMV
ncbi:hypothetical protein V8C86DRAFT_2775520 [Haematococcus lacustris]